ncbi:hypothetical protein BS78_01G254300 [Paspalum vaginatum]|nr:hypothetical protein BS78_01G254300 [Paspalum vaginatum]
MSLIAWNCRGSVESLRSPKMLHVARLISSTSAQVIFISETCKSKTKRSSLINNFSLSDAFIVPVDGLSGGLWLLWKADYDIDVKKSSPNYILTTAMYKPLSLLVNLVCVYRDPHHSRTTSIWQDIHHFVVQYADVPTLCMGDLNVMNEHEKLGPHPVNHYRMLNFCNLVKECGFIDLGYNGPAYTWTNKRFNSYPTFECLDRCLANAKWCTSFPRTTVYHMPMMHSDHAPILTMLQSSRPKPKNSSNLRIGGSLRVIFMILQNKVG